MSDLIERQAAIDAVINADYEDSGVLSERRCRKFETALKALPPAQPDVDGTLNITVPDYTMVKNIVLREPDGEYTVTFERPLKIIRCKECEHNNSCDIQYAAQAGDEFHCGYAERRESNDI